MQPLAARILLIPQKNQAELAISDGWRAREQSGGMAIRPKQILGPPLNGK